jgi:polygalacturonase
MRHPLSHFFAAAFAVALLLRPLGATEPAFREPPLPTIPRHTFNVTKYGAKGDGMTINTRAVQAAINAASAGGGGTVIVPRGEFLCGPIQLASHINLLIEAGATLRMLPLDQYPGGMSDPADFISGKKLQDVAITGGGTIEGQGGPWWPFASTKEAKRPVMISLKHCDRVLIEKLTLKDSPMFHIAVGGKSSNITVRGVTIRAPASNDPVNPSRNTDACDVSGTNILIRDCDVSVCDDDFTCGGGTSNVLITHCTYGYGHGVSVGSYANGGVSNITVTDCSFKGTEAGIRIKSDRDRGGVVSHLTFRNLRMTDVGFPILIYGAYMATEREFRDLHKLTPEIAATYPAAPVTERTPVFRDITFSDITATVQSGRRAGLIWGLPEAPASNVVLRNVNIIADRPFGIYNAQGVRLENCKITTPEGVNQLATTAAEIEILP